MEDQMKPNFNPDTLSVIPVQKKTGLALRRKTVIIIILLILTVSFITILYLLLSNPILNKSRIETKSLPSPTANKNSTPTNTPVFDHLINFGEFSLPDNVSPKPFNISKIIYYLKNGDIWKAKINPNGKVIHQKVYVGNGRILDFTISHNQKDLAFLTRKNVYPLVEGVQNGDTVVLVNLNDNTEKEIFSDSLGGRQLKGIEYSPDDKKIYFTNDQIYVYDSIKSQVSIYDSTVKPYSILCNYDPVTFSPDQKYLLLEFGCWEGSKQVIWDTINNKAIGEFNNGYIGGGNGVYGFINNDTLLGYDDQAPLLLPSNPASDFDYEKRVRKIGIYQVEGKLLKILASYNMPGDNINQYTDLFTSDTKVYYSLPKKDNLKEFDLFEMDRKNNIPIPASYKSDLVFVSNQESGNKLYLLTYNSNSFSEIDIIDDISNGFLIR